MIQRIQSIYLLLAALATLAVYKAPLFSLTDPSKRTGITLFGSGYESMGVASHFVDGRMPWGVIVLTALVVILALWSLFSFKNRKRQIKLIWCTIIAELVWLGTAAAYACSLATRTALTMNVKCGYYALPILTLIFLMLALRGVRHDERLIRAADRLR